ncbi:glycine zipper 2TM domain-containing protein [Phenylobacterium sp.]|jgi:hypothetical protein|uniref:glycine zipper 2TM domain-containing protein n=1 Tax=Phenylobacterium sp. TaxID=1871053 RepID=UPI002F3E3B4B
MTTRSILARSTLTAVAGVMALTTAAAVPSFAQAQSGGYYDPCRRDQTNRGTVGGVLGALAGAAIGSNVAARKNRTEGALLGGAVGAVGGAVVGNNSAACRSGDYRSGYYDSRPSGYYSDRAYDRGYQPDYGASQYDRSRYYSEDRYGGDGYRSGYADSYTVTDRPPTADGCTLAESPIYLPDGRVQKRFVRVCPDASGRYQVVE